MTPFADFATLCRRLEESRGRLEKRRLATEFLAGVETAELATAVAFMTGRPFPSGDPRVLSVRGLPWPSQSRAGPPLTLAEVAAAFAAVADASGVGSRRLREERLTDLAARASPIEREMLARIIGGEMRTGVSDGLVLEAIAAMAGADAGTARRAALFLGDLSIVATVARAGGAEALAAVGARLLVPLLPMLAEIASGFDEVLAAHGGRTALEYKYDGARVQIHSDGDRVSIWTRRLSDVTRSLPDIVELARRDLAHAPVILDGEVVALDAAGRPLPFQELMRRFRRVHDVDALAAEIPLALHLFDCLMIDGEPLIDRSYAQRWEALSRVTGGRYLATREVVASAEAAHAFHAGALTAGHEGVMAKDLDSPYAPGGRGKRWFKLKTPVTIDCVIVAADRGSGRRVGWLSNYHLAVKAGDEFADVGKTFKGLTDQQFGEMTARLKELATTDDGYTVRVRPAIVVEVEYNEIQKSPRYRSGLALRFARIARVREDKSPTEATTLEELRALYERQFEAKGRTDAATATGDASAVV